MRSALVALALALGCQRSPAEPEAHAPPTTPAVATAPTIDVAARSIALAVADGGAPTPVTALRALALPLPQGMGAFAFTDRGGPRVAAVDARGATVDLAGAERVLARWAERQEHPDAQTLARVIGAFAYPRYRVLAAGERVGEGSEAVRAVTPAVAPRPGGGRTLTFGFAISEGEPGAGVHVARLHLTASGLVIDESPHPERR